MDIIDKVCKSRKIIKEIFKNEYNTDTIPILSNSEIKELYELNVDENIYSSLSGCPACCFSISHNIIDNCNLHIIYYNFPILGNRTIKINKRSFIEKKIIPFYENDSVNQIDSIIIILNELLTESIQEIGNTINILLHDDEIDMEKLNKELSDKDINLDYKHFRNIFMFDINTLLINLLEHDYVPTHEVIRDKKEINEILKKYNSTNEQLPIILKNDAIAKLKLSTNNDLIKITRNCRNNGEYEYYRIVK